jgi:leader peptidase (prepilin peptidase)/N-methyltransferase
VKLAGLMGMLLGFPAVLMALWAGIVGGGVVAIALIAVRLRGRKDAMPFGPFLSVAGIAVLLVGGDSIAAWYLDMVRSFAGV